MIRPRYSPEIDYCGPSGSCKWCRKIRAAIPRSLFGVDYNEICYEHDISWLDGIDLSDDLRFHRAIVRAFRNHGKPIRGHMVAAAAFLAVRIFSLFK